ncbi:hypothetical protein TNCV_2040421 [Trichonephila clavipes]|nr:hypothetical protein TNCV_2040421 [Trichonephila clavipes]
MRTWRNELGDHVGEFGTLWHLLESSRSLPIRMYDLDSGNTTSSAQYIKYGTEDRFAFQCPMMSSDRRRDLIKPASIEDCFD